MVLRAVLGTVIGGGAGFALGYFGRCSSGTCPLTSNPYTSTILGVLMGLMIAFSR